MIVGVVGAKDASVFVSSFAASTYQLSPIQIVTFNIGGFIEIHIVA